jgi:hypothetical protein
MDEIRELSVMIENQKKKLLFYAQRIIPYVCMDDLFQPQDFPELELHPEFRYEEGVLMGMQAALAALLAMKSGVNN